jgi:micrococcal nuclease
VRSSLVRLPVVAVVATATLLSCGQSLPEEGRVKRVIDGDTIELADGRLVRYAGIDTPEVRRRARPGDREWRPGGGERWVVDPEPFGQAATDANAELVGGRRVRLEYDVQTHDRVGRLLAYVYVGDVMVNAELLSLGVARPLTIPPNVKYAERFRALADEARQARRGLWAAGDPGQTPAGSGRGQTPAGSGPSR